MSVGQMKILGPFTVRIAILAAALSATLPTRAGDRGAQMGMSEGDGTCVQVVWLETRAPRATEEEVETRDQRSPDRASVLEALLRETNAARSANGAASLKRSDELTLVAQRHAEDMLARGYFAHVSPEGEGPSGRVERVIPFAIVLGVRENITKAEGDLSDDAADRAHSAIEGWLKSPGHRKNLLNKESSEVGFGYASGLKKGRQIECVVQLFGIVAGTWLRPPDRELHSPTRWRATLRVPLEFFIDDSLRPSMKYQDPDKADVYWKGGVPLVVSTEADGTSAVAVPRLEAGPYTFLARRAGSKAYQELFKVRVITGPDPGAPSRPRAQEH